jgi:hypothetical protein
VGSVPDWMTMPKNSSSARRNAARALAAAESISYTAALRRLENLCCGMFQDSDFRIADRVERYPSSQHLRLARGNGYVELRSSTLEGTAAYAATAVRFTEDQFDRYQLGARAGYPTGQTLEIDRAPDGAYAYRNAEDAGSSTLASDQNAFLAFLDGVFRGEFGGPSQGITEGLTNDGPMTSEPPQRPDWAPPPRDRPGGTR